jgi:hypothetical protein
MQDTIETTLLRKCGDNRRAIEKLQSENKQLWSKLKEMDSKISSQIISDFMSEDSDREAYLRGETGEENKS